MVLTLILDVIDHFWDQRFVDRKGGISILPRSKLQVGKFIMDPLGRFTFKKLGDLAWGILRRRHDQRMEVIFNPADTQRGHSMFSRNSANKLSNSSFNFLAY